MAGFLKGGPRPGSAPPKGAHSFMSKSSSTMPMPHMPQPPMMPHGDGKKTEIEHHEPPLPDGTKHTVTHSDGEVSKHPNAGHMAAHMHAKHDGGDVGNMHRDDEGKVTTHDVGPDGEVNGPMDHGTSPEEGANHLVMAMNGNDGEMPMAEEPDGDEGESYG